MAIFAIKSMEADFFKVFGILQKIYVMNYFNGLLLKGLSVFGNRNCPTWVGCLIIYTQKQEKNLCLSRGGDENSTDSS